MTRKVERLIRQIVPEWRELPIYVAIIRRPDIAGAAMMDLDLVLKPKLLAANRWRGRGAAILINPGAVAYSVKGLTVGPRASVRRWIGQAILAVGIHEVAHQIDLGINPVALSEIDQRHACMAFDAQMSGASPISNGLGAGVPFRMHGAAYIRILLHLIHRAQAAGFQVYANDVFNSEHYELSSIFEYGRALGDEPARLAGHAFEEIKTIPMPESFAALWRWDVHRWIENQCARVRTEREERKIKMIGEFFGKLRDRMVNRTSTFHDLARDLAEGRSVKPEAAERILSECGKSPEELEALVNVCAERARMREELRREPALRRELADINKKAAVVQAELDQAEAKAQDLLSPMQFRADEIQRILREADRFRQDLKATCPEPALRQRHLEAHRKHGALTAQRYKLSQDIVHFREVSEMISKDVENDQAHRLGGRVGDIVVGAASNVLMSSARDQDKRERAGVYAAKAERAERELAEVESELAKSQAECDALDELVSSC